MRCKNQDKATRKTFGRFRRLAVISLGVFASLALNAGELTSYLNFDDTANPLAATVGEGATVVNYSKSGVSEVAGLGNCTLANGVLTIPQGQALRVEHGVGTYATRPWCISMRMRIPSFPAGKYATLFASNQSGTEDGAICIKNDTSRYWIGSGGDGDQVWGPHTITEDEWHLVTISAADGNIRLFVDGVQLCKKTCTIAQMRAGRLNLKDRPYLFMSADNDGEDQPLEFDWVKIYNVAEPEDIFPPTDRGLVESISFDDASNPLAASVGTAATVVNYSQSGGVSEVEGLGNCTLENGVLTIPQGQALRVAHGLSTGEVVPWCLSMRFYLPENTTGTAYNSLFSVSQEASADSSLCIKRVNATTYQIGGGAADENWGYFDIAVNAWHEVVVSADLDVIRLIVDGKVLCTRPMAIDKFRGGRMHLKGRPYLFISADENGEDAPLKFDWIKVYDRALPEAAVTMEATWIGGGDRTNPLDEANWIVSDRSSGTLLGGAPDGVTDLVLAGPTSLNVPMETAFDCGRIKLTDMASLSENGDWRGLRLARWVGSGTLDIASHDLTVTSLRPATNTDMPIFTDSGDDATLCVEVAADLSEANVAVGLNGNLALEKTGTGSLIVSVENQSYVGGTRVREGTLALGTSPVRQVLGAWGTTVTVDAGATLDLGGRGHFDYYKLCLAGGTVTSTDVSGLSDLDGTLGDLTLTADSFIRFSDATGNLSHDLSVTDGSVWNLGGHALDIAFAGHDPDFSTANATLSNGIICAHGPGWFHLRSTKTSSNLSFDLDCILRLQLDGGVAEMADLAIGTNYVTSSVVSEGTAKVFGIFTPLSDYCFAVELEDGATLNLADRTGPLPSTFANGAALMIADQAQITVTLGARSFKEDTKIFSWSETPTATFAVEESLADRISLKARADGLYACPKRGFAIIVM